MCCLCHNFRVSNWNYLFIYKLIDYLRVKHAKEQYQAVLYDHIENRDLSTIHAKGDSGDDYPIDIMFCDQCNEEKEDDTTAEGKYT